MGGATLCTTSCRRLSVGTLSSERTTRSTCRYDVIVRSLFKLHANTLTSHRTHTLISLIPYPHIPYPLSYPVHKYPILYYLKYPNFLSNFLVTHFRKFHFFLLCLSHTPHIPHLIPLIPHPHNPPILTSL